MTLAGPPEAIRRHLQARAPIANDVHAVADTAWELLGAGLLDLPVPGQGETITRWRALAEVAAIDLAVAQLVEGHLEAQAVHADAGRPLADGLWATWSAMAEDARLIATYLGDEWVLDGAKRWCSGARSVTHAVVTARDEVGVRTFVVPVRDPGLRFDPESWPAVGMALADTLVMTANRVVVPVSAELGGAASWFTERPGYWPGLIAQAATWYGGALGIARALRAAAVDRGSDPFVLVHLGFADAVCEAIDATLERAAAVVDTGVVHAARTCAWQTRATVEHLVVELLRRSGQALGAGPLSHDPGLTRRVADLTVSLRRHGAEREYAALGADVLDSDRLT